MNSNNLSWKSIYSSWRYFVQEECYESFENLAFKQIQIKAQLNPKLDVGTGIIDWWPSNEVELRIQNLNDRGISGAKWNTIKGFKRTAEILWDNKENKEQQALIWILAGLNEIMHHLPEEWRGDPYRFIREVRLNIMQELKERNMEYWNSSIKRFLPVTVDKFLKLYSTPMNIYNLMNIVAIDNIFSKNSWTLVNVSREEDFV
ncbi:hypothetical protein CDO73_12095 [Saccharibacillus sp. O23]|uniref:hypothetical protein n=1 Tax=Saccharibacillus sp. O23 TaxID=2009338 RepID=UPI000B4E29F6|nr:hypothetical protein [Saccharibacillus sp. O23]OWR29824.1 hypothetical protein CDO73_12095 [Saccharibacillus sp. O23]